jgi:PKD repeat protein
MKTYPCIINKIAEGKLNSMTRVFTWFLRGLSTVVLFFILQMASYGQVKFTGNLVDPEQKQPIEAVAEYELYSLDPVSINQFARQSMGLINMELNLGILELPLQLMKENPRAPGMKSYQITEAGIIEVTHSSDVVFRGSAGSDASNVAFFVLNDNLVAGTFSKDGKNYIIEPYWWHHPTAPKDQVILYESSVVQFLEQARCGTDDMMQGRRMPFGFKTVTPDEGVMGLTANACREVQYGAALDWSFVNKYGGNNGAYDRVNFVMGLVQTQYTGEFNWDFIFTRTAEFASGCSTCDPWSNSNDAGTVLSSFRNWGNGGGFQGQTYDVAGLWTNRTFNGGTVGIAYVGGMCNSSRYHALRDFSSASWAMRVMVAHELGHNLSYGHDAAGSNFIMAPAVNNTTTWSTPSRNAINNFAGGNGGNCMGDCPETCENFAFEVDVVNTSCNESNGVITVTPSGGVAPYLVNIGNGFVQQTVFTNLAPGTYTVIVKDAVDCEDTQTVTIAPSVRPSFLVSSVNTSCGEENGIIEINVLQGNPPYEYNIGFGPTSQNAFFDLPGGTYTVVVTDIEGCSSSSVVVILPSDPLIADIEIRHTTCGNNNGRVTLTTTGGTPPYRYTYNGIYRQSPVFDSLPAGNYTFEVQDAVGCLFTVPATINPSTGIIATSSTIPASCGASNGSITITVTQGVSPYTYTLNGVNQSSNQFAGLSAGNYTIVVTDNSGCTRAVQATVANSSVLTLNAETKGAWCGLPQGEIKVNPLNGAAPFMYDFGNGFQSDNKATQLAAGTYTVDVMDDTGCEGSITVVVATSPAVQISGVATPSSCQLASGTILITGSAGTPPYTYMVGANESQNPLFTGLSAGVYVISIRDSLGCEAAQLLEVPSESGLTVVIETSPANCGVENGIANATASGGTAPYLYNVGNGPQSNGTFSGLKAGSYGITVTDNNNCSYQSIFTIAGFDEVIIELDSVSGTRCGLNNGSADISVSGGSGNYRYFLNDTEVNGTTFQNLAAGNYTFRVEDSAGCVTSINFTVESSQAMSVNLIVVFSSCENPNGGITAEVSGGTLPYGFNIGNGVQANNRFLGLNAGMYSLTISDAAGCEIIRDIQVGNDGEKPTASFRPIFDGYDVAFVNTSRGEPESYLWDFGDGNTSAAREPRHRYETLQPYTVCLTVRNECGENTVCSDVNVDGSRNCQAVDSLSLVALYRSTGGDNWTEVWDLDAPVTEWAGLGFDGQGCLVSVSLEGNNLVGILPEELRYMRTLQHLNLAANDIQGTMPDIWEDMAQIRRIYLQNNAMSGAVPASVLKIDSLTAFWISGNAFNALPDLSPLNKWLDVPEQGLRLENNRFTFEDLYPSAGVIQSLTNRQYHPQAKVYKDTLLQVPTGLPVTLDLDIDRSVPGVKYRWFRNGAFVYESQDPILTIASPQLTDAGTWWCEITQPELSDLTLQSHFIELDVLTGVRSAEQSASLILAPNPVSANSQILLQIQSAAPSWSRASMIVLNAIGQVIWRQAEMEVLDGVTLSITAPASPGTYFLQCTNAEGERIIRKFVVF